MNEDEDEDDDDDEKNSSLEGIRLHFIDLEEAPSIYRTVVVPVQFSTRRKFVRNLLLPRTKNTHYKAELFFERSSWPGCLAVFEPPSMLMNS